MELSMAGWRRCLDLTRAERGLSGVSAEVCAMGCHVGFAAGMATTDLGLPLGAVLPFRRRVLWLLGMSLGFLGSWRFGRGLLGLL